MELLTGLSAMKLRIFSTLLLLIALLSAMGAMVAYVSRTVRGTGFMPGDVALLGAVAVVCGIAGRLVRVAARAAEIDERL